MIIGIMGKAGSGKDTVSLIIENKLMSSLGQVKKYAFASGVKDVISTMFSIPRNLLDDQDFKKNKYICINNHKIYTKETMIEGQSYVGIRRLMQLVGTECFQTVLGKEIWVNKTMNEIILDNKPVSIITDVRFKHEYKAIKHRDGITIRIVNPNIESTDKHISECDLDDVPADYTIINDWKNNPENLIPQINELVRKLTSERFENIKILQKSVVRNEDKEVSDELPF